MIVEDTETLIEVGRAELERRRKIGEAHRGKKMPPESIAERSARVDAKWQAIWQARLDAAPDEATRHRLEIERNRQLRNRERRRTARAQKGTNDVRS